MEEQLIDTWRIHCRVQCYLLEAISADALGAVAVGKGRGVGAQFAHLHNVRLMWLKSAAPDLLSGLAKIEPGEAIVKDRLRRDLAASATAIADLLRRGLAAGRIAGFKPHPVAFLGYLIAHEAYHNGDIGVVLTQAGHPLDKKTSFGIWEWGVR